MDGPSAVEVKINEENPLNLHFPCSQCDRNFNSARSLRCHVKVHNDKILKCCFCEQMFNRTDTLFMHTLDHISKGTLPCQAENCQVIVESMLDGETHANAEHNDNGVTLLKCKECSECQPSFRRMLYHHTFKHGELKEFAEEMTARQKEFLRMKKNQSRKEKKTVETEEKDVKIELKMEEEEEILEVHENPEDRLLEQLQKALTTTTESNTEMIGKLSDVIAELFPLKEGEQYQCLHCTIGFSDAILWMNHLGFHDVNEPFKCTGCGRQFQNRQTFALHLTYFAHGAPENSEDVPKE